MKTRLLGLPRYSSKQVQVSAELFNCIRLALIRVGKQLRLPLPGLRHLDALIDIETWICVDRDQNDMPIIAWLNFKVHPRNNLHEPVSCDCYCYHSHAEIIEDRVLDLIKNVLEKQLHTST